MDVDETKTEENPPGCLLNGIPDIELYTQDTLRSMFLAIKAANLVPSSGDEYDFYSSFKGFRTVMKAESKNLLSLMKKILRREEMKGNFEKLDLEDQFDALMDVNDTIIERIGNSLDEASGKKTKTEDLVLASMSSDAKIIKTSWNKSKKSIDKDKTIQLLAAKNIGRPQMKFKDGVDNSNSSFIPKLKEKPNSIKPLAILLENTEYGEEYSHPYELEIEKFSPSSDHLSVTEPEFPKSLEETDFKYIDNVEDFHELVKVLNNVDRFAVDLEAHSYRSFLGFTCLMQISTDTSDYIVDTLELRSEMQMLNESFTNPAIVKVFHGSDSDIEWLQRDFGVYVVNLFDTYHASHLLGMPRHSLAFLLSHYCNVEANKQYQLADWRIRPLPDKMMHYAREDSHYLLYIYDCMKKRLIEVGNEEKNLLKSVFSRSSETCLKRYKKPICNEKSHMFLYNKSHKYFNARQMYALESLYRWRDSICRAEDESTGYVLPNHMLLQICQVLPREQQGILACCNPLPPLVKQQLNEIHLIILEARQKSLITKIENVSEKLQSFSSLRAVDVEGPLHCPHDLSKASVNLEKTPSLLNFQGDSNIEEWRKKQENNSNVLVKRFPVLKAFNNHTNSKHNSVIDVEFVSPFQRYEATDKKENLIEEQNLDNTIDSVDGTESAKKLNPDDVQDAPKVEEKEKPEEVGSTELEEAKPLRNKRKRSKGKSKNSGGPPNKTRVVATGSGDRPFQAFDYNKFKMNEGQSKEGKHFNPNRNFSNLKGGGKSRVKQKGGQKSSHMNFKSRGGARGGWKKGRGGKSQF